MFWGSLGTYRSTSAGDLFARFGGSPWHSDSSEAVLLDLYTSLSVKSSNKVSRGRSSQRLKSFDDILRQKIFFVTYSISRRSRYGRPFLNFLYIRAAVALGKKLLISLTAVEEDLSEAKSPLPISLIYALV